MIHFSWFYCVFTSKELNFVVFLKLHVSVDCAFILAMIHLSWFYWVFTSKEMTLLSS